MKSLLTILALCLLLAGTAFAVTGAELPPIVWHVVGNRDFFANPWTLKGYDYCILFDVKRLDGKRIGVGLIAPSGMEFRAVYGVETLKVIYVDAFAPEKSEREAMRRAGISVSDTVKLARFALEAEARLKERDLTFQVPGKLYSRD
jgi:hypothetical protein